MLTKYGCASSNELRSYLAGDMTDDRQQHIAAHLEDCAACQESLARAAGGQAMWQEAASMLEDYRGDTSDLVTASGTVHRADKKLSGIDSHLANWMGPTDDPTKLGRIGHYEVIGIIGYGGAGVVLRAHDSRLNRAVAIKALLPALAHNPMARRRFQRESRAVAAIVHQNVVPIYTVDIYNEHPYIAMQYVAGRSLQQRIDREGALAVAEIVRIAIQITQALVAAHAQGIIHRDIKPANILLENTVDRAYVTDFGLARVVDDATTHSGMVTGTPQYMSPEQCHGNSVDHRSDLFSLGSVMYAMCTGQPPFKSQTLMGMLRKVCESQPHNILDLNPEVPAWLQALVFRLLSKNADDRIATADQLAEILQGELAHVHNPNSVPVPARDWVPQQKLVPLAVASESQSLSDYFHKGITMILIAALLGGLTAFLFLQDDNNASGKSKAPPAAAASSEEWELQQANDKHSYYESKKTESALAKQGGTLTLKLDRGHAKIKSAEQDQVSVEQIRQVFAGSADEAEKVSESLTLKINSNDGNVEVVSQMQQIDDKQNDDKQDQPRYKSIEYVVTVPAAYSIAVDTQGGHVSAEGLKGKCELKTAGGHVECNKIDGDVILDTQGGHVAASKVTGNVDARTAGGHVELNKVDGTSKAFTQGGNISGNKLQGDVTVESHGGNIELISISGKLVLEATSGNVELKNVAGEIQANAESGNVTIAFPDTIKSESKIGVGSGNVELLLPKDAAATLRAVISEGQFHVAPEFTEKSKKDAKAQAANISNALELSNSGAASQSSQLINREFNGGGPGINVRVGNGQLSIELAR